MKPGDKIKIGENLYEYPKLLSRRETMKRLRAAKANKTMTPDLQVVHPKTRKIVIEADYGWKGSTKEVLKKITED